MILKTVNLRKMFGSHQVLKGIDLEIETGDFYGLVGRNGAGKTTLINALAGINRPTSGEIIISDDFSKRFWQRKIGVMSDTEGLYKDKNAYGFLKFMASLKEVKLSRADIDNLLDSVSLDVPKTLAIKNYSFGMKKKLGLAQALIGDPEFIILDEPTSGVDPESVIRIHHLLACLNKKGKTILIASHSLDEIEKLCNKVSILKDGIFSLTGDTEIILRDSAETQKMTVCFGGVSQTVLANAFSNTQNDVTFLKTGVVAISYKRDLTNCLKILSSIENINIYELGVEKKSLEQVFME